MPLDLLSVMLSAIGVIQNLRRTSDHKEQISRLRAAFDDISVLHQFLKIAKLFHDDYEKAMTVAINQFVSDIEGQSLDQRKSSTLRFFMAENKTISVKMTEEYIWIRGNREVPAPISMAVDNLVRLFPEFLAAVSSYGEHREVLIQLHSDETYGKTFVDAAGKLQDQAGRVISSADDIILNTVDILIFNQYLLRQALHSTS